jgi:hypothetical protein
MSLTGNFDLNEISILTDKMRIPGGDDLKRATKGKKKMKTIYSFDFCLLLLVVTQNPAEGTMEKYGNKDFIIRCFAEYLEFRQKKTICRGKMEL